MDDNVIRFPGDQAPLASEDAALEAVAMHADAYNACREKLESFKPEERAIILAGLLGTTLCECGKHPSRSLAISLLGLNFEAVLDMINRTYGDREGRFS
jgi:hypothetical protein